MHLMKLVDECQERAALETKQLKYKKVFISITYFDRCIIPTPVLF